MPTGSVGMPSRASGHAAGECDGDLGRHGRRRGRIDRPLVDVGGRRGPRVLEHAGLDRPAPEVGIDGVGRGLGDGDLDAARVGVLDLLVAREAHPDAHRGDDLEATGRGRGRRHRSGPGRCPCRCSRGRPRRLLALGDLDQELRDERPGQGRRQRVDALVERVGLQVGPAEVGHEALAGIDDVGPCGAGADGPSLDALAKGATTDVDGQGHDLDLERLLHPRDSDRRVEAARVREDDLLHGSAPCDSLGRP